MKELLLGWLLKPHYKTTMLDGIMFWVEFIILLVIIVFIYTWISDIKDRRNK